MSGKPRTMAVRSVVQHWIRVHLDRKHQWQRVVQVHEEENCTPCKHSSQLYEQILNHFLYLQLSRTFQVKISPFWQQLWNGNVVGQYQHHQWQAFWNDKQMRYQMTRFELVNSEKLSKFTQHTFQLVIQITLSICLMYIYESLMQCLNMQL